MTRATVGVSLGIRVSQGDMLEALPFGGPDLESGGGLVRLPPTTCRSIRPVNHFGDSRPLTYNALQHHGNPHNHINILWLLLGSLSITSSAIVVSRCIGFHASAGQRGSTGGPSRTRAKEVRIEAIGPHLAICSRPHLGSSGITDFWFIPVS